MKSFVGGEDREEDGGCNAIAILARFSANTSQQKENTAYRSHASFKKASGELTIPHQARKSVGELAAAGGGGVILTSNRRRQSRT